KQTAWPRKAALRTTASPMPRPPPVTRTTCRPSIVPPVRRRFTRNVIPPSETVPDRERHRCTALLESPGVASPVAGPARASERLLASRCPYAAAPSALREYVVSATYGNAPPARAGECAIGT